MVLMYVSNKVLNFPMFFVGKGPKPYFLGHFEEMNPTFHHDAIYFLTRTAVL